MPADEDRGVALVTTAASPSELATEVARELAHTIAASQPDRPFHLSLTGGTMGSAVLAALAALDSATSLPWERVHLWWSDERFLPTGDEERNVTQNTAALGALPIRWEQAHPMAASDEVASAEDGAQRYTEQLAEHGLLDRGMDLVLLGVGPDGHIASLFPGRELPAAPASAVHDSPKPPPTRITLSLDLLNNADRVWLVVAGADKAEAVASCLNPRAHARRAALPAAQIAGVNETRWWLDAAAGQDRA